MHIPGLLALNARKYPEKTAIVSPEGRFDWATLERHSAQLASLLQTRYHVETGDRLALYLPNSYLWVVGYFATQRLGAMVAPINARLSSAELSGILADCNARVLLTISSQPEQAGADPIPSLHLSQAFLQEELPDTLAPIANITPDAPCTLLYTSGTTGKPKGVLFNHHNLLTVATTTAVEMAVGHNSCLLHMMPLTHSAPLHVFLLGGTLCGATHVILPEFRPDLLLDSVEQEKVTHFFGAPVAYLLTAGYPGIGDRDLSSMQAWIYGGGPLSAEDVIKVQKAFKSDRLYCVYGLTEVGPSGSLLTPEEHQHKAGSIGCRGALHTEVRLVDEQGQVIVSNAVGEIQIRTEAMMLEYWNQPEATAAAITAEGWLNTGDLAQRDEDGYLWILGRKKDLIISGGVNIYPREIETWLEQHPLIAEVAVIGVPHPEWGETVKACVVFREPVNDPVALVRQYLQDKLADYKLPRLVSEHPALPRNANGKVMKHQLQ